MLSLCQEASILFRHAVIRRFSSLRSVLEILSQISSRALSLTEIEMLLHSFVANLIIFVMCIVKSILGRWVLQHAIVRDGILGIIPIGTWG